MLTKVMMAKVKGAHWTHIEVNHIGHMDTYMVNQNKRTTNTMISFSIRCGDDNVGDDNVGDDNVGVGDFVDGDVGDDNVDDGALVVGVGDAGDNVSGEKDRNCSALVSAECHH